MTDDDTLRGRETPRRPVPIEIIEREALRVGHTIDAKSFLYGYHLGRGWPMDEDRIRWHAEIVLGPNERNAHLARPGDDSEDDPAVRPQT